jgi:hypothetical protein
MDQKLEGLEVADDFHPEQTSSTILLGIITQIGDSIPLSVQGFHLQLRGTSVVGHLSSLCSYRRTSSNRGVCNLHTILKCWMVLEMIVQGSPVMYEVHPIL